MTSRGRGGVASAIASSLAAFAGLACSSGTTGPCTVDCISDQVTISIPADVASSITATDIHLSNAGCAGATLACANQTNGCTAYDFTPTGAGECDVEVDFPTTVFTDTLQMKAGTSCCPGFYSTTSSTIDVPEPTGDAG